MFDTTIVRSGSSGSSFPSKIEVNSKVTEIKAPTNESLELLESIKRQIRDDLVLINSENNNINFVWSVFNDKKDFRVFIRYEITINNNNYRDEMSFRAYNNTLPHPKELRGKIVQHISNFIANQIFNEYCAKEIVNIYLNDGYTYTEEAT